MFDCKTFPVSLLPFFRMDVSLDSKYSKKKKNDAVITVIPAKKCLCLYIYQYSCRVKKLITTPTKQNEIFDLFHHAIG